MKLSPEAAENIRAMLRKPADVELERRATHAHDRCKATFRTDHHDAWRNKIAAQLNTVLGRIQYEMETCLPPDECDVDFAEATLALVDRVADFEEIEMVG
jgi:hypothetical protein